MPKARPSDIPADGADWAKRWQDVRARLDALPPETFAIGQTPKTKIAATDKATLYRYDRATPSTRPPILIVYGLVGRYTMADLLPECSVVLDLLGKDCDLFITDWGNPDRSDQYLSFDDYVCDYLDSFVDHVRQSSGHDKITLLGICEGGTFASLYATRHPEKLNGVALTITPLNFHGDMDAPGMLNRWLRRLNAEDIERLIDLQGCLPGAVLSTAFQAISPKRTWLKYGIEPLDIAQSDARLAKFLAVETWLADRPDHPGAAAKQLLINLYKNNELVTGNFVLDGTKTSLRDVTIPVLNIYGKSDPVVPPACTKGAGAFFGSTSYTEIGIPCGHAGAYFSTRCKGLIADAVTSWMPKS